MNSNRFSWSLLPFIFASSAIFAPIGCTNEESLGGRSDAGAGAGSFVEACQSYRTASAVRATRCRSNEGVPETFDETCQRLMAAPGMRLVPDRPSACAAKFSTLPCDQTDEDIEECVFWEQKGTLPNGAACALDGQCASGSCAGSFVGGSTGMTCGTCQPFAEVGEACGPAECISGAFCSSNGEAAGSCERYLDEGEPCVGPNAGVCDDTRNVFCDLEGTATCRRAPMAGEACDSKRPCSGPLTCIENTCALPRGDGESCASDTECGMAFLCDAITKRCVDRNRIPVGKPCPDDDAARCERGSTCYLKTCVKELAPGASCERGGPPCAAYYYCGPANTCQPLDPAACK
jgi:hypothetical protein